MGTKGRTIFPKQIVATKMRTFLTFRTQIVFAYFSKNWHFYKKDHFGSQPPQKQYFSGFSFWNFRFPIFSCFLFFFRQHKKKKTKTKCAHFFKTFFDNLTNCQKYFRTPLFVFFKIPQNTIKLGKNKQKILDQVLTQPWTKFWLKKTPNLGPNFDSTAYIYIYNNLVKCGDLRSCKRARELPCIVESQHFP